MESSFYFIIFEEEVNVVHIVLSMLGFKFFIVCTVFILLMNFTVVK